MEGTIASPSRNSAPPHIAGAVALVSAALILIQISFTRLIGYRLFYHFVFLAIALSLLGLGAAGARVAARGEPSSDSVRRHLGVLMVLIPISLLALANPLPLFFRSMSGHGVKLLGGNALIYLGWCSIFMLAIQYVGGLVLAEIFSRFSRDMGRLYARDLIGAALGCVACVLTMKYGSPPFAFASAVLPIFFAWLPFRLPFRRGWAAPIVSLGIIVVLFVGPQRLRSFESGAVIAQEWNHIIRTDHRGGSYILDGDADTPVTIWSEEEQKRPLTDPAYLIGTSSPSVAIIGFGGGPQVAEARRARAKHILAIDINPTIARWVVGKDRALNRELFIAPQIEVVVGEGRHVLRSSGRKFDLIAMHAIDTYAATVAGAYALSENFLYTKEAFGDYFGALSDEGLLVIRRWLFNPPREDLRLFVTALEALRDAGLREPENHLVMMAPVADYDALRTGKSRVWGYLMVSRRPFPPEQIARLRQVVAQLGWSILHAPGVETKTAFSEYIHAAERDRFRAEYPYVIKPVTDASPYLFQFYDPLHASSYRHEGDWAVSGVYQSSSVSLLVSLLVAVVLSLAIIVFPLARARRPKVSFADFVYFAGLGCGFMALEVPLVQILSLYLGHPTYGFSVVLVALLLSTGVGAALTERFSPSRARVCALIAALLVLVLAAIFPLIRATIGLPDVLRFAIAMLLAAICGLVMGMPLALRIRELAPPSVAWAWAVNGSASVVASTLVMIVMVFLGAHAALALGAFSYAAAAIASFFAPAPARAR